MLFPGAVWVGVSADGLFAGWLAWGVALLAIGLRSSGRRAGGAAFAGGLLLGGVVYLSYGLVLGGLLAVAVLVHGLVAPTDGRWWRTVGLSAAGAVLVVAAFTLAGFSWLDGYSKVRVIYAASIAAARPYSYFVWANLAAVVCAIGPAGIAGLRRVATRPVGPYLVVARRWPRCSSPTSRACRRPRSSGSGCRSRCGPVWPARSSPTRADGSPRRPCWRCW